MFDMTLKSPGKTGPKIPVKERKELLRGNIRSIIERTSLTKLEERKNIEESLRRISSIEIIDPEIERLENEQREKIRKAREALREIEEDIEEEGERILSDL